MSVKRASGFYWIKFQDRAVVAEWIAHLDEWRAPGVQGAIEPAEVMTKRMTVPWRERQLLRELAQAEPTKRRPTA